MSSPRWQHGNANVIQGGQRSHYNTRSDSLSENGPCVGSYA